MTLLQDILNNPPKYVQLSEVDKMYGALIGTLSYIETLVFHDYVAEVIAAEIRAGRIPAPGLRLPYDNFWVEWPCKFDNGNFSREGFLVGKDDDNLMRGMLVVALPELGNHAWTPVMAGRFRPDNAGSSRGKFDVLYTNPIMPLDDARSQKGLKQAIRDLIQTLFVLTIPKMASVVAVSPSRVVNKARIKKGKHPIIEYKKVVVDLMKPVKASPYSHNIPSGVVNHKRLHQVQGHIRTLMGATPQGNPRHTWVSPHWRGDPHLGVIIHDKTIQI